MTVWVDVVARARGLSGRLLRPAALADLAAAPDLRHLAASLAAMRGRAAPEGTPSAVELEAAERRHEAAQLRLLARWAGPRVALLSPLFEEEDCRSLRALLRGAITRTPAAERLAGLIPTPALPPRSLALLAAAVTPAAMAGLLATWGHPFGSPLLAEASRQQPDLFAMEHALVSHWATRSRRAARRAGAAMRTWVARQVDAANCWAALLVAGHGFSGDPATLFIDGGTLVTRDHFVAAARERGPAGVAARLERLVRQTPLEAATDRQPGAEDRVRRALAREQHGLAARDPLGVAPIIEYWLRLRGEAMAVRRIIWGAAAGVPARGRALQAAGA